MLTGASICGATGGGNDASNKESEEEKDNLDKFLANHTSEDNESFYDLQRETEIKHRFLLRLLFF